MSARNLLFTVLGCLLVLGVSSPTSAQDANDLSEELAALQIMNQTVGPMLTQANTRKGQMKEYIQTKDLISDWSSFSETAKAPEALSFEKGYQIALQRVKTEQPVSSTNADFGDLQKTINATKSMVESEWNNYGTANAACTKMSSFLTSKNMLTDYEEWSKTYSKKRAADWQAKVDAANEKDGAAAQNISDKFKAQQQYLMQHWDEEMHLKGLANSSGYVMSRDRGSIVADSHQYPYLDSQLQGQVSGMVPQGGSYFSGSWNNGYADPYYDVWGFPKGHKDGDTAYKRTVPPQYHPGALRK